MTENGIGWIEDLEDQRDYFLETVIRKLTPQEVETETKNIKLERALFAEDDDSHILQRAMRLVPEDEWNAKRKRHKQPPYLILPFVKKDKHKEHIASLQNQDLFLPESVDLREWFCEVQDQKRKLKSGKEQVLPTCTAHAGAALMEYFQNRISGNSNKSPSSKQKHLSWRFLYTLTRKLMVIEKPDILETEGATIRDTLKAMALFGVTHEKCWEDDQTLDNKNFLNQEPPAFCYAFAQNYQASHYFRLDRIKCDKKNELLKIDKEGDNINDLVIVQIRIALASGFPAIFGIRRPEILSHYITKDDLEKEKLQEDGKKKSKLGQIKVVKIDVPEEKKQKTCKTPKIGHALVAVGYDDTMEFDYPNGSKSPLKGAFLIRNSKGKDWGDEGYGWLPYYYVQKEIATDWWSLLTAEWINTSGFGIGTDQILGCCQCGTRGCAPIGCC